MLCGLSLMLREHSTFQLLLAHQKVREKFIGARQVVALVKSIREEFNYPIFINADHTYTFEGVKEAIDLGYDSVIFDGAQLPYEENLEITKKCVEYAQSVNPDILVEAELGYIGTSSMLLEDVPEGVTEDSMTTPEQAREFVEKTGVHLLAPSVGNLHGMLKNAKNPNLDIERIKVIREAVGVPLVLHGGSGISDKDFTNGIAAGIGQVHINTEIRKAWREAVEEYMKENPEGIAPYKILKPAREAVKKVSRREIEVI